MPNIIDIFQFIEDKRGYPIPFVIKLVHAPETITKEDLNVKGNLGLTKWKGTSLPEDLKVSGFFTLSNPNITLLPKGLEVGRYLWLCGTNISSLPPDIKIGKNLVITDSPISHKYTREQIKQMCPGIKGKIVKHGGKSYF
jgi:hypothetical protein